MPTLYLHPPYADAGETALVFDPSEDGTILFGYQNGKWGYAPAPHILTAGYGNRAVAALIGLGRDWRCHVVDIRLDSRSDRDEWCYTPLSALLRNRYRWLPQLGNLHHADPRSGIEINDLAAGVAAVEAMIAEGKLPLLLCACGAERGCHRAVVARELRLRGWRVREIFDWPAVKAETKGEELL